mgnify:CR=1 FL=1
MKLLEGIRVLDISTVIAAPFAAGLMADFGAEVIKVEMPDGGDPFRRLGPYHEGQAMRFACMGRNKKSITLDLRTEKGKEIFLQLVEKSDVVIENFRTGTLDKANRSLQKYSWFWNAGDCFFRNDIYYGIPRQASGQPVFFAYRLYCRVIYSYGYYDGFISPGCPSWQRTGNRCKLI